MSALGHALLLAFLAVLSQHAAVADVQTRAVSPACDGDGPEQRTHRQKLQQRLQKAERHQTVALLQPSAGMRAPRGIAAAVVAVDGAAPVQRTTSMPVVTPQKPGAPRGPPRL